ncbi:YicC family protein [Christensenellaceae bacterium NSJ-44]|uniref:YicC family protein n=1 Tax=Luoshenia tenuis TaxID=2763654 RepID=A0A926CZG2_9FIRM|nr:YicC/YloC family endoribonuclease [Luoshenia tenuis]MBC8528787.1 YicC family protein [Luoshenia tenuis]
MLEQQVASMTGYGRATAQIEGREMTVEVKTVNHRYLDIALRLPRVFSFLEDDIRKMLQSRLSRGHVEFYVNYRNHRDDSKSVEADVALAKAYMDAIGQLSASSGLQNDVTLSFISRLPEVLNVSETEEDQDALRELMRGVLSSALDQLKAMRLTEGQEMVRDVSGRIETILVLVGQIEARSTQTVDEYYQKLRARIAELLENVPVDPDRIATEAAVFADKASIAEETVRLRSHMQQFLDTLRGEQPCGRKLDFIVQEMNREINTVGSKASDAEILSKVVDVKSEIEKIREQVQNIE